MAPRRAENMVVTMLSLVLIIVVTVRVSMAQIDSGCVNVLISLSPCLDYVTGNASVPSSVCCSQLAFVVRSQPQCLCEVVNGGAAAAVGLNINQTQALALPTACRVQTPPLSICKASSPPTPSAPAATGLTNFPTGNGYSYNTFSSASGSGGRSSSHGNSIKLPPFVLGFSIIVTCLNFLLTKDLSYFAGHI